MASKKMNEVSSYAEQALPILQLLWHFFQCIRLLIKHICSETQCWKGMGAMFLFSEIDSTQRCGLRASTRTQ